MKWLELKTERLVLRPFREGDMEAVYKIFGDPEVNRFLPWFPVGTMEGEGLDEDMINEYFTRNFKGDCLLAVGDEEMIKIHFHTNEPWRVLEYCASLGEIYDIVIEDMDRQSRGLKG